MPAPVLDAPPPLPDSVKSQMGPPDQGMNAAGPMLQKSSAFGGAPNAQGALRAQVDAVKKVLQKVVDSAGAGKQFFSRAMQLLEQGMSAEAQKGPGSPAAPTPDVMGSPETSGNKMPGSFPG
jgi:hypothetical protein